MPKSPNEFSKTPPLQDEKSEQEIKLVTLSAEEDPLNIFFKQQRALGKDTPDSPRSTLSSSSAVETFFTSHNQNDDNHLEEHERKAQEAKILTGDSSHSRSENNISGELAHVEDGKNSHSRSQSPLKNNHNAKNIFDSAYIKYGPEDEPFEKPDQAKKQNLKRQSLPKNLKKEVLETKLSTHEIGRRNSAPAILPDRKSALTNTINNQDLLPGTMPNSVTEEKNLQDQKTQAREQKPAVIEIEPNVQNLNFVSQAQQQLRSQQNSQAIQIVNAYENREKSQPDCWDSLKQCTIL